MEVNKIYGKDFQWKHPTEWDGVDLLNAYLHVTKKYIEETRAGQGYSQDWAGLKDLLTGMLDDQISLIEIWENTPGAFQEND